MRSIHWFRKGLRLHDNPAMMRACERAKAVYPVFVLDPRFADEAKVGAVRFQFLLDALADLDRSLRAAGSRLFVVRGDPSAVLPRLVAQWDINRLSFEADTEPYAQVRDQAIRERMERDGVEVCEVCSHTLWSPAEALALHRARAKNPAALPPTTYGAFLSLAAALPAPPAALDAAPLLAALPPVTPSSLAADTQYDVPPLAEIGNYGADALRGLNPRHTGGETEALRRLADVLKRKRWVAAFEKPKTNPTEFEPASTTALSPYLKFGCLSPRRFWHGLKQIEAEVRPHSKPPTSLTGQLLWREFYYLCGHGTPNYDRMQGNPICRQVPWDDDAALLAAWSEGRTGFPWIDACMVQLRTEGWLHHLARHAVACFLTRGDLWQSWEKGAAVFDRYLVDADWALNNGNWMWLSCSCFFYQYFRCYGPVSFGQKYDKSGAFVRKYLPQLRRVPDKYIYEPWRMPPQVQQACGCVVGVDYPTPIVDHAVISKRNMARMKAAYDVHKANSAKAKSAAKTAAKKRAGGANVANPAEKKKKKKKVKKSGEA
eukprot:g1644.t1